MSYAAVHTSLAATEKYTDQLKLQIKLTFTSPNNFN